MEKKKKPKHKLSAIPTAYEETQKIVGSKNIKKIENSIQNLEKERRQRDEKALLTLINDINKGDGPMVKMVSLEEQTFQQALGSLLSIRNTEAFEVMMLLYEYMEKQKTFKIDKLTGTELLKLSGAKSINQEKRHRKLILLLKQSYIKLTVLDPEQSLKNYRNKKNDHGLVYKIFDLLRIKKVIYSETNPETIVQLEDIEFLPEYIEHLHIVSKRYIPLETIRKIPEDGLDKSRHFVYKLCFKLASIKGNECELSLNDCMNLGKFLNKSERDTKRKWKPIEKALLQAKELGLIDFKWNFKDIIENDRKTNNIKTDLFGEIDISDDNSEIIPKNHYKYIKSVTILRVYNLNNEQIVLPFTLENEEPKKDQKTMKVEF